MVVSYSIARMFSKIMTGVQNENNLFKNILYAYGPIFSYIICVAVREVGCLIFAYLFISLHGLFKL